MKLYERLISQRQQAQRDNSISLDQWASYFGFGGLDYPILQTSMGSLDQEKVARNVIAAYETNGPVFALVLARMQVFSQIRFQWTRFKGSQPGDLFGTDELGALERPAPGKTTSDLLARMEQDVSLAGNSYIRRTRADRLNRLRPDWVTIVLGSQEDADDPSEASDVEVAGYLYAPPNNDAQFFFPNEVAHYAPIPDPLFNFLGMSWITPVIRELQADSLATEHKAKFFTNGATPNLAIKFSDRVTEPQIKAFQAMIEDDHEGVANAYKTLYLGGGADVTPVGADFKQIEFTATQGKGESRLASAAGVPPSWVGFSEGLQGSALNAGNFSTARRRFSDGTMVHLWTNVCASLEPLFQRPTNATLWYDDRIPFMREDAGDRAEIQQQEASTIVSLINGGYQPDTAVAAVKSNDWSLLKHTGLTSVQLQPPKNESEPFDPNAPDPPTPAADDAPPADTKTPPAKGAK